MKRCVKPYITEAFGILTDGEPSNDWYGYYLLAGILSCINEENALAAWKMIRFSCRAHGPTDLSDGDSISDAVSLHSSDSDDSGYKEISYQCYGACGHSAIFAEDMYYCRECNDVQFDEECLHKLKSSKLEWRVCRHDHESIQIPKWDSEAAKRLKKVTFRSEIRNRSKSRPGSNSWSRYFCKNDIPIIA